MKWEDLRVLNKKWASYIKANYCKPGTMCGLIKTRKENNPIRVITSGCSAAIKYTKKYTKKLIKQTLE